MNHTANSNTRQTNIIDLILKEAGIKPVKKMLFEEWLKGKKFVNTDTKKQTPFFMLPVKQKLQIKKQYEQQEDERIKKETKELEEAKRVKQEAEKAKREEYKKNQYPEHKDYKWTDAKLNNEVKKWSKDTRKDLGDRFEGSAPDLAESFLFQFPGIKNFLRNKRIKDSYHKDYIADLLVSY